MEPTWVVHFPDAKVRCHLSQMQSGLPVFMIETTGRESRDEIYLELRAYTVRVYPRGTR